MRRNAVPAALIAVMTLLAASFPDPAAAQAPPRALDIERLRAVPVQTRPGDVPTCDVLVVGGGLGGVAAAEVLARQGLSVILTEPTSKLGGQLTAQAVPVPDENSYIERSPGPGTQNYRALREQVRARYARTPGIVAGREQNVGVCWVSRVSGEPAVWEGAIRDRLAPLGGPGGIRRILLRHQLVRIRRYPGNNRVQFADFADLDTGRITRVGAQFLLDASEMGDAIALAGCPWTVGQEARAEYDEPDAPEGARPEWIQSFTYCFGVRWTEKAGAHTVVQPPAEYDYFKSLGEYTLGYDYSDARGRVYYKVFGTVPGAGGPFWTYRRLLAASSFRENPFYRADLSLINWRGNDFHEENPIGKPLDEQIRIFARAKAFSLGFLHWLQTECPRDDGAGAGYPEMQLDPQGMDTPDGFGIHPYIRESRRLQTEFTLTESHLAPDPANPEKKTGEAFFDSVGIALYAMDIHPSKGEPPFLSRALPYHLPLGAFIPRAGPPNVLPAGKNLGGTRLALSSARMHPTEWLCGEIAGHLAAFCLQRNVEPTEVRNNGALLSAFQAQLKQNGITTRWDEVLP